MESSSKSSSDKKPETKKPANKKVSKEEKAKMKEATDFLSNNLNQMTIDHFKREAEKQGDNAQEAMRARIAQYDLDSDLDSDGEDYMFEEDDASNTLNLFEEEWEDVMEDLKKQAEKQKNAAAKARQPEKKN
ncbi:unnamed protein product [Caenorhabditis nigoni]